MDNDLLEKLKARTERAVQVVKNIETLNTSTSFSNIGAYELETGVYIRGKQLLLQELEAELALLVSVEDPNNL